MSIKSLIKRLLFPNTYDNTSYIKYLQRNHVIIGDGTFFFSPNHTTVDVVAPYMIKIGCYCKITSGVTILAHDYSRSVFRRSTPEGIYMGGRSPVNIGDNVFIGINSIILMGTTIGDNCIIGAGAVVKGNFPSNSVIAGNPAKVICSTSEYYDKCKSRWVEEAKRCVNAFVKNSGRLPTRSELSGFSWMFTEHSIETVHENLSVVDLKGDKIEEVINSFLSSKPIYKSYEDFIDDCNLE